MAMKIEEININLEELKEFKRKNMEERLKFIDFWANYVKTHPDKVWSKQQNVVIDSQIRK
jgi:hypothetical protein